jgi:hypothetical protein
MKEDVLEWAILVIVVVAVVWGFSRWWGVS